MLANVSDERLVEQARSGSAAAFEELYCRRQASIYAFAFHMTGDASTADDVTQETFLTLIGCWSRYDRGRGEVLPFLYGIARNVMRAQFREPSFGGAESSSEVADETSVELDLQRVETIQQVREAILSLPGVYREAVVLCELEELEYVAAASALEIPLGTLRSRLHRGRMLLAQKLKAKSLRCGV